MKTLIALALLLAPALAEAKKIYYFGGHRASQSQVSCWAASAGAGAKGIPYGSSSFSRDAAVAGASSSIAKIVKEIDANPNEEFVIVGHSSGAAASNAVAERIKSGKNVTLVNLDGFRPSASAQKKVKKSTCWYATNGKGLSSLNAGSMKSCGNSKAFSAPHCKTRMCLHFSIVNTKAPSDLSRDYGARGYNGCTANKAVLQ